MRRILPTAGVCCSMVAALLLAQAGPALGMSVESYLAITKGQEGSVTLNRYLTGMRDGLYEFNDALVAAGIKVFCPPPNKLLMEVEEFRDRVDAELQERQETRPDFKEYAAKTTLGLVALEVLNELYLCDDAEDGTGAEPGGG